jgi:ABC-type multidrug transport system ATPase subunit
VSSQTGTLTIVKGPSAGQEYTLTESELVIGRYEGVDLVIDAPVVSRRHARIVRRDAQYYIEDLNSSNGTFLNGQPVDEATPLAPGDEIGLGQSVTLRFSAPAAAADRTVVEGTVYEVPESAPQERPAQEADKRPPRLLVQMAGRPAKSHSLQKDVITVGRAEDNDVVIDSRIVSRHHARLERSDGGYRLLVSPQASNPVLHRGQPLDDPRQLQHNDELRIGQDDSPFQVILTYEAPHAAPEATVVGAVEAPEQGESLQTMRADELDLDVPQPPTTPEFSVQIAGEPAQTYPLERRRITIGRAEDNDIILTSRIVSRHHAILERSDGGYRLVPLPDITNPVLFEGRPLDEPRRLRHEDKLRIGGLDPGSMVTMTYVSPDEAVSVSEAQDIDFGEKTLLSIGRDASNDIVLDNPTVSRYHAQIERVGQRYRVTDLRSANGTFVNDQRIEEDVWLQPEDTIRIGPHRFVMGQDALAQYDESSGLHVEAVGLNKWVRDDLNILKDISLLFQPREFIVVVGQSGGGKSTLIDAIAGYRPATHGSVHVNDIDVYKNFDAIRSDIGYVPQRDIIHMELTIFQALDYAAQLRMPADTTTEERHGRIMEVLEDLDLAHRKDTQISQLSGGQQKRVSIGVELLTKPGLFFLDEPTSGLDPGTETSLMQLMRRLADQGRTITLITHATKNVMLADKVVFLARGGHLVWYGPPDEALRYFDKYRSERDRRARDIEFDEIYALLDDPNKGDPETWAKRFREHPAYQKYIAQPLEDVDRAPQDGQRPEAAEAVSAPTRSRHVSSLRQFMILSARNIKILTRDKFSLALMLAAAPLVAMLQLVLATVVGSDPFDFSRGTSPSYSSSFSCPPSTPSWSAGWPRCAKSLKSWIFISASAWST